MYINEYNCLTSDCSGGSSKTINNNNNNNKYVDKTSIIRDKVHLNIYNINNEYEYGYIYKYKYFFSTVTFM